MMAHVLIARRILTNEDVHGMRSRRYSHTNDDQDCAQYGDISATH